MDDMMIEWNFDKDYKDKIWEKYCDRLKVYEFDDPRKYCIVQLLKENGKHKKYLTILSNLGVSGQKELLYRLAWIERICDYREIKIIEIDRELWVKLADRIPIL